MQFVNFFEPHSAYRRPQYSYDDVLSYLAQQEYENQLAEEYRRRQAIAARQREEYERQRYLQFLQEQKERRIAEEQYRRAVAEAQAREKALERKRRLQQQQELREQQQREREQNSRLYYHHPVFDLLEPFFGSLERDQKEQEEPVPETHSEEHPSSEDEDPDVSIPSDDDLYSTPYKSSSFSGAPRHEPLVPNLKSVEQQQQNHPASEPMDLDDFVSNIFTHFLHGSNEGTQAESSGKSSKNEETVKEAEKQQPKEEETSVASPASEDAEPEEKENEEERVKNIKVELDGIKSKLQNCVETYDRLFSSETSGSDSEYNQTAASFTSRIKILQKTQMQLEKLYTELDSIRRVPVQLKKLKHELTSKSVTIADKVDDLIRVLEGHRTELLEKELRETEESSTASESEEDQEPSEKEIKQDKSEQSEPEATKNEQPKLKKIRRVVIETVADESDF